MPRLNAMDVAINRALRRDITEGEIKVDGSGIDLGRVVQLRQERFHLRSEKHAAAVEGVKKRLLTYAISCHEETLARLVPDSKGEHATQFFHAAFAILLVQVNDRFR